MEKVVVHEVGVIQHLFQVEVLEYNMFKGARKVYVCTAHGREGG